jgi:RimJ/RimL family protein N-acetyltransferase
MFLRIQTTGDHAIKAGELIDLQKTAKMAEIRPFRHISKSGKTFFIRAAQGKDAAKVLFCAQGIIGEKLYSVTAPEEFSVSLEQEIDFLEMFRKDPGRIFLVAETEDREIVGTLDFAPGYFLRHQHWGEFGMGVMAHFRGEGVGSALLDALLTWVSSRKEIEKICLTVHANNERAISLYKKAGFEVEGVKRRETRIGPDEYLDAVLMAKFMCSKTSNDQS